MVAVRALRILYMEDDLGAAHLFQKKLQRAGYQVALAQDGRTGLALYEQNHFDLLVVDQQMPYYDGLQVIRLLAKRGPLPPIIMITGRGDEKLAAEAIKLGAGDYIVKDVDANYLEVLPRAIEHLLEKYHLVEERQKAIDEKAQMVDTLRQQTAELRAHVEELEAFAHTVAHDLKNPLELMIGYAAVLGEDYNGVLDETGRNYVESIVSGGQKASAIIDDLLLLSEVRKADVQLSPVNMADIVDEARRRLSQAIQRQQAQIIIPQEWPVALGYAPWLEEVWVNYLSNALKYGDQPPEIQLGATLLPNNKARFWIRNGGPELSSADISRLFTPFTRLNGRRGPGHGLGLSIVRRIVEKMDGHVRAENEEGYGPVFSFTLRQITPPGAN
ncbi:MAG TPA: response regulator [Aggregatilineales bacterium]|nr:response regulator [Aggregatilineales bacterium]